MRNTNDYRTVIVNVPS